MDHHQIVAIAAEQLASIQENIPDCPRFLDRLKRSLAGMQHTIDTNHASDMAAWANALSDLEHDISATRILLLSMQQAFGSTVETALESIDGLISIIARSDSTMIRQSDMWQTISQSCAIELQHLRTQYPQLNAALDQHLLPIAASVNAQDIDI